MNFHQIQHHINQLASYNDVSHNHMHDESLYESEHHVDLDRTQHTQLAEVRIFPGRAPTHAISEKSLQQMLQISMMFLTKNVEKIFLYVAYMLERIDSYIIYVYRTVLLTIQSEREPLSLKIVKEELIRTDQNKDAVLVNKHAGEGYSTMMKCNNTSASQSKMTRYVLYLVYKKILHGE